MHKHIAPAIHYWGTPVILISTVNVDNSVNVAPMSSAWWLGWSCMLGLDATSQTVLNLRRTQECVLNLAACHNIDAVNRLALSTGARSVPLHKKLLGYTFVADKLGHTGLSTAPSTCINTPRLMDCSVQLECRVVHVRPFATHDAKMAVAACSVELQIVATHVDEALLTPDDRVDPSRWQPLLMNFRELCVARRPAHSSRLARGDESSYAPWKQGRLRATAGRALKTISNARAGIPETDETADASAIVNKEQFGSKL
jgi:flavin reductase (DIM6/NTAB) family NADH-FMN oxidoreductase RutF